MSRFFELLSSSVVFALVFQGINGLIQVKAFFSISGIEYLEFSAAYLAGTVLSLIFSLNFENIILAGRWSRSVRAYYTASWIIGLFAALVSLVAGSAVPSYLTFCCFGLCFRLFLAWANLSQPSPLAPLSAGVAVMASCLMGDLNLVMVCAMLAFPLAAWRAKGPTEIVDAGIWDVLLTSGRAFVRFLPHTLSGLALGYLDRYVALNMVGGLGAEGYLRTLQVCSWAAFLAYPVVFWARRRILHSGNLSGPLVVRSILLLTVLIASGTALMWELASWSHRMPPISITALVIVMLAVVCSQSYQVASTLNFVRNQFSTVNGITLTSAAVVLLLALSLVPAWKTAEALAVVFFAGWFVQLSLTLVVLRRR